MKKTALYIGFFLLFGPQMALAQTIPCSAQGYTIVFVNGVFDSYLQAEADRAALALNLKKINVSEPVTVRLGYNPTHLAGLGDLTQSLAQEFSYSVSDYDLQTILMQIYPEVTTRKLLLVGHSQGAYYTSELYKYLLAHSEPKDAVNVYDVGTPAPQTVDGGKYLNSSTDTLLGFLHDTFHYNIMPSNIDISLADTNLSGDWHGHSFVGAYLAGASDRVVSDISGELSALVPTFSAKTGGCFTPPDSTFGYKTQRAIFTVADPTAVLIKNGAVAGAKGVIAVGHAVSSGVSTAFNFLSNAIPKFSVSVTDIPHTEKNFLIMKKLYGSSLDTNDVKDLLGDKQGSAVILALPKEKPIAIDEGFVEGTSTGPDATSSSQSVVSNSSTTTATTTSMAPPFNSTSSRDIVSDEGIVGPVNEAPVAASEISGDAATTTSEEATSTDQSTPPPAPPPIPAPVTFLCAPYEAPFVEGQEYIPTDGGTCSFTLDGLDSGGYRQMEIYKGTVGNATLISAWYATPGDSEALYSQTNNAFGLYNPQPGDSFFAAVDTAFFDDQPYLETGQGSPPPDLTVLNWKWGTTQ